MNGDGIYCKAVIEPGQIRVNPLIFDAWVDTVWNSYVHADTTFALAYDSQGPCELRLCGPGFLSTKPKLQHGDTISDGTIVAYFATDGEDIPYGRPYCDLVYAPFMTPKSKMNPNEIIAPIIDAWCARRELKALSCLLPAWINNNGLTDDWEILRAELAHTYAMCTNLPPPERDELKRAIAAIDIGLASRL